MAKLVICRSDLPENPDWAREGYPYANCWDTDELMLEAERAGPGSKLYREARRIYWECTWRLLGRYRRGRPFFETYLIEDGKIERVPEEKWRWVCANIIASAMATEVVPEEAKRTAAKLYRRIFGPVYARR